MQVKIGTLDPLAQTREAASFPGQRLHRGIGREVPHVRLGNNQVVPRRCFKGPVALPHPRAVEHHARSIVMDRRERIGIEHPHLRLKFPRPGEHSIHGIPVKPAVQIAPERDFPDTRRTVRIGPPHQRKFLDFALLAQCVAQRKGDPPRPRRKQPEHRLVPPHQRPERQIGLQFVKENSRHQRHSDLSRRLARPRPRHSQRLSEIERLRQRKTPQMSTGARRVDHAVHITVPVAHSVGYVVRQTQPVIFTGHELEALSRRFQKTRRGAPPYQHVLAIQFLRPQPPRLIADRLLPAIKISRHI